MTQVRSYFFENYRGMTNLAQFLDGEIDAEEYMGNTDVLHFREDMEYGSTSE